MVYQDICINHIYCIIKIRLFFVFYFKINILSKLKPILLTHLYAGKNKEIEIHFLSCLILTYQSNQIDIIRNLLIS